MFSLAAQFGNTLFATTVGMFNKFVGQCLHTTSPTLCLNDSGSCVVPALSAATQRILVPVSFYVAAFIFGPSLLAKAKKTGVQTVLSLVFGAYGTALFVTPLIVYAVMSFYGAPPYSTAVTTEAGFWAMLLCSFGIGICGSGLSLLPDLVVAACVDLDSAALSRNRSGSFFGARQVSTTQKLLSGISSQLV